jgi:allophanate hydrolase subunit 2
LRTYLAVRGGVDVPAVLGSRSYDVLGRLGPRPIQDGDELAVGPPPRRWPQVDQVVRPVPAAGRGVIRLTGRAGPHAEALADGVDLGGAEWTVSGDSDRSAVRLDGRPLARREDLEWPVEGVARGAVQLPPAGRPVVMLADHPVTGGYPAIGCLDDAACDRAAQLRPGDRVRLELAR